MAGDKRVRVQSGRRVRLALGVMAAVGATACGARTGLLDAEGDSTSFAGSTDAEPDVDKTGCTEITYIYVMTEQQRLYRFDPPAARFTEIGEIRCPGATSTPNSMAVERSGTAYVVFLDGQLFKVSTRDASCSQTPYVPNQLGWTKFGMGFATRFGGPDETLYVADTSLSSSRGLAIIDTTSFVLKFVGPFSIPLGAIELTGTGDGRLFGFSPASTGSRDARIVELSQADATVLSDTRVRTTTAIWAFAFAHWGEDFYIFTAPGGSTQTTVTRFRPRDDSVVDVATLDTTVVGAGVSTCAPQ